MSCNQIVKTVKQVVTHGLNRLTGQVCKKVIKVNLGTTRLKNGSNGFKHDNSSKTSLANELDMTAQNPTIFVSCFLSCQNHHPINDYVETYPKQGFKLVPNKNVFVFHLLQTPQTPAATTCHQNQNSAIDSISI
ncbi:hypothetical protein HanIR_Chr04g0171461 [Helianthus annuus]|nr:hypothetical protein HanIR_Chr04g0171461 [Helianthus annuus]